MTNLLKTALRHLSKGYPLFKYTCFKKLSSSQSVAQSEQILKHWSAEVYIIPNLYTVLKNLSKWIFTPLQLVFYKMLSPIFHVVKIPLHLEMTTDDIFLFRWKRHIRIACIKICMKFWGISFFQEEFHDLKY